MQKLKGSSSILCLIWRLSIEIIQYDMGHCKSAYNEKLINSFNHEILRFLKHYLLKCCASWQGWWIGKWITGMVDWEMNDRDGGLGNEFQ